MRRVVASRSATSGAPTAAKFEIETHACAHHTPKRTPPRPALLGSRVEIDSAKTKIR